MRNFIQPTLTVAAVATLALLPSSLLAAQNAAQSTNPNAARSQESRPSAQSERRNEAQYSGKITGVNRKQKTITIEDRQQGRQTLHVGNDTRLSRGTESASWDALKEGEQVRATATKAATGEPHHALSIEIEPPQSSR